MIVGCHEKSDPALDVGQFLDIAFGDVDGDWSSFGLLAALTRRLLSLIILYTISVGTLQPQQMQQVGGEGQLRALLQVLLVDVVDLLIVADDQI